MVYTERAEMAAVSSGTSHICTKQRRKHATWVAIQYALPKDTRLESLQFVPNNYVGPTSVDIKHHIIIIQNHMRPERSESARQQRIALYKSHQQLLTNHSELRSCVKGEVDVLGVLINLRFLWT